MLCVPWPRRPQLCAQAAVGRRRGVQVRVSLGGWPGTLAGCLMYLLAGWLAGLAALWLPLMLAVMRVEPGGLQAVSHLPLLLHVC